MPNTYAQNKEDIFILKQFKEHGKLLSIGENDGTTFSNSRLLIEMGFEAWLVEPSTVCGDLMLLHKGNDNVHIFNYGIGDKDEVVTFWESGAHVPGGDDKALVSTTDFEETKRWPNVEFTKRTIQLVSWKNFYEYNDKPKFDFISIDAEGYDWKILQQINLEEVGCKVLCIEWNSDPELLERFTGYCKGYSLKVKNAENLIFVKEEVQELPKVDMSKIKVGVGVTCNGDLPKHYDYTKNDFRYNVDQITIAHDKNKLIKELYDAGNDWFFIFDDDTFPIKEGWEQFFIEASIRTGCQHFILGNDAHLNAIGGENGLTYFQKGTGCMLFLTRHVIEEVGYMNNKYGKYGYEHAAYSARIFKAGLTPAWYTSVDGWEEYIYSWDLNKEDADKHGFVKIHQFTEEEKTKYIAENEFEYRKEVRGKKIYYDYEQIVVKRKKRVGYVMMLDDGSNYYRLQGVLPFIRHDDIEMIDLTFRDPNTWSMYAGLDVLIMPRPFDQSHLDIIETVKSMNIWVITDYDDDVLHLPEYHPAYDTYNGQNKPVVMECIKKSDEVWVTTRALKESLYNLNHNTHIIPNAHNDYLFPVEFRRKFKPDNKKVSYRGGNSHRIDLKQATKQLVVAAHENPEWEFMYIGVQDNQEFLVDHETCDNKQVYLTSKMPVVQYLNFLYDRNAPVMICPLAVNKLNKAKSNIAWLEATYAGSAFFGEKKLPEFNHEFIFPMSLFGKAISENHIASMRKSWEESWRYINENLLLSKINLLRIERLLK